MKRILFSFLASAAFLLALTPPAPAANVSVSLFYESLEPYGEWVDSDDYGYVWHPRDVGDDWRPYTVGSWAYTDAGWTWISEEPFGWATYHYGRWVEIERVGWTWVPDREWGPAWVSWRRSDRHVGWAPLPPEARFEARTGFHAWVDSYYDIGPSYYTFVKVRDLGAPRLRSVIVAPRENITIINETRNITNITYVNNVVINNGPEYDVVVRESAQPIRRLKLERRTDIDFRPGADRSRFAAQVSGETLRVAAPMVEVNRETAPKKVARKLQSVEVNRGWKNAGDPQAVEKVRAKVAAEAQPPADLPPAPRLRGSDRPAKTESSTAPTDAPTTRPGATTTAEPGKREMKQPGSTTTPPTATTAEQPPRKGAQPKTGTTAQQPKKGAGKDRPVAGKNQEEARTPGVAEVPATRDETKPETGVAKKKADQKGRKPAPIAAGPDQADAPPSATTPDAAPQRPEARDGNRPQPPTAAPRGKQRKNPAPAPEASARAIEPAPAERPPVNREAAERPNRPEAAIERPDRPAPKVAPPAAPEAREPKLRGPAAREDRSPERARPQAAERSPENRPPAPEGRPQPVPKKGPGKPEKATDADKDDKKKD